MKQVLIILFLFISVIISNAQTASFSVQDTVCVGDTVYLKNTTPGSDNRCQWIYDALSLRKIPTASIIPGVTIPVNNSNDGPAYIATAVDDSNNFYSFVTKQRGPASIYRQSYGNSFANTPTNTMIINLDAFIPGPIKIIEGIDIQRDAVGSPWYGFVTAGLGTDNATILRLDFGNSLKNTPTVTSLANFLNFPIYPTFPHAIKLVKEAGLWIAFICDPDSAVKYPSPQIDVLIFENGLASGNNDFSGWDFYTSSDTIQGSLTGIAPVKEGNTWYLFVTTDTTNSDFYRLEFSSAFDSIKKVDNLSDLNGTLDYPHDVSLATVCSQVTGMIVNNPSAGPYTATVLDFTGGLTDPIIGTSLPEPLLKGPISVSDIQRVGTNAFFIIVNQNSGHLVRLMYNGGSSDTTISTSNTNPMNPKANNCTPAEYTYINPGKYNISLTVNSNILSACSTVVVLAKPPTPVFKGNTVLCSGMQLILANDSVYNSKIRFNWIFPNGSSSTEHTPVITDTGLYTVFVFDGACNSNQASQHITFNITIPPVVLLNSDIISCTPMQVIETDSVTTGYTYLFYDSTFTKILSQNDSGKYHINPSPGSYLYYVIQKAPDGCESQKVPAQVTILKSPSGKSGIASNFSICSNINRNLFIFLSGNYNDIDGKWYDIDHTNHVFGDSLKPYGLSTGIYQFTYRIDSIGTCPGDSTTVTIPITAYNSTGKAIPTVICNTGNYVLFNSLTGYDAGGFWTSNDTTHLVDSLFKATGASPGVYKFMYNFNLHGGCSGDSTPVIVTVSKPKNPGTAVPINTCSNYPVNLFNGLTNEDQGGNWISDNAASPVPDSMLTDSMFNPKKLKGGTYLFIYKFTVAGCPPDSVIVIVNTDTVKPKIICHKDTSVSYGLGSNEFTAQGKELDPIYVYDSCGIYYLKNNITNDSTLAGVTLSNNITSIIWTIEDNALNTASCITRFSEMLIPNFFSPDADGHNDTWSFSISDKVANPVLELYDRWGNKLMEFKSNQIEWDGTINGKEADIGTYRYVLMDANTFVKNGFVTLVRNKQ